MEKFVEFYVSTKYELCRFFLKIRQTFSTIYNFPQNGLWNCLILKTSWKWKLWGILPAIVEITPEVGRLRTDLASGHLRKNSISLKFLAHACACTNANFCTRTLSNFFPQSSLWNSQNPPIKKVPKQLFHKLLCGIFKTSLMLDCTWQCLPAT